MTPYRRTFQQHRRLLIMPVVLAVALALWTVGGSPKAYESSTSLWVDYPPPGPSSLTVTDPSMRTPSDQHKLIFDELLRTRDFLIAAGRRGPLERYLQGNPSQGWGPLALLSGVRGGGPLDASVIAALGPKHVTSEVAGPQLLQITYRAGDPRVAAETLRALVNQYDVQLTKIGAERIRSTLSYHQARVDAASTAVAEARDRVDRYAESKPGATSTTDPHMRAVVRAQRTAGSELSRATAGLNRASSDVEEGSQSKETGVRVVDAPRVAAGPLSGNKLLLMAMFGGLFAGGLVSLLGLIALTPSRPSGWDAPPNDPFDDAMPLDPDGFLGRRTTAEPARPEPRAARRGAAADGRQRARVGGEAS
jgi:uncharacterized protein involved in exopolysaccharide biosynthesis